MTTGRINQVTISTGHGTDPHGQTPERARVYYCLIYHPGNGQEYIKDRSEDTIRLSSTAPSSPISSSQALSPVTKAGASDQDHCGDCT